MEIIIVSAGKATRLAEHLQGRTKCLANVANKSILYRQYEVLNLVASSITVICHKKDVADVQQEINKHGMAINVLAYNKHNGSANTIWHSCKHLIGKSVLFVWGDLIPTDASIFKGLTGNTVFLQPGINTRYSIDDAGYLQNTGSGGSVIGMYYIECFMLVKPKSGQDWADMPIKYKIGRSCKGTIKDCGDMQKLRQANRWFHYADLMKSAISDLELARDTFANMPDKPNLMMYGSAKTKADEPEYKYAIGLAQYLAPYFNIITGSGPGLMEACNKGASAIDEDASYGIGITLPDEPCSNPYVADKNKMLCKQFFTRKIIGLIEADAILVLPGGLGSMDELFEVLTMINTGKLPIMPIVLAGNNTGFWSEWANFVTNLVSLGYVSLSPAIISNIIFARDYDTVLKALQKSYCSLYENK